MRVFPILILCFLILFTGCSIINSGKDLNAFSGRMNRLYKTESFSPDGYINDSEESCFLKYFTFGDKTLLLKLGYNEEYELTFLSLAGRTGILESEAVRTFTENSIKAFLSSTKSEGEISFENIFAELESTSSKTNTTKLTDSEIITDSSELGWVITVQLN